MLVCLKKHRGASAGGASRLVAERCFTLSEIVVVDLKDAGGERFPFVSRGHARPNTDSRIADLQNAIKVKRGKETIIYRTDKPENKKMLLLAFKKVAEELINKKRKEMLSEAEARKGDVRYFIRRVRRRSRGTHVYLSPTAIELARLSLRL